MMGQSDRTFTNEMMYSTGNDSHPYAVASTDLNNDGRLDLVVANEGTDSIGVLVGFDYTTFPNRMNYFTNDSLIPIGVVVSDFDNDSFPDIVSAFAGSGKIGIFLGYGNGNFIPAITYSTVVSDIRTNKICVLLGYGNRSFATVQKYSSVDSTPVSVAVGDMNNDNQLDLLVANYDAGSIGVLLGHGDATFAAMQLYFTEQNFQPESIVLADLNDDGRLNAVIVDTFFDDTAVVIEHGSGTALDQMTSLTTTSSQPRCLAIADFNNDNRLDIATVNYFQDNVDIYLSNGNGTFALRMSYSTGSGSGPTSFYIGDFNNDNILDIVVANFVTKDIGVLYGIGDGTFLFGRAYSTGIKSGSWALAIGNFNNDTWLDIAATNLNENNILILLGNDNEPFTRVTSYFTGDGSRPRSVAVGDINNDHQMDIIVANYGTDNVSVLLGHSIREFVLTNTYSTRPSSAPYCVAIADLNNDNCLDIVVTTSETDNIVIFLGNGNGTFVMNATYSTGRRSRPYTFVINDFNNDNRWDIAVANSGTSNIFLIYGNGWMDLVVTCYDTDHIEIFIQKC